MEITYFRVKGEKAIWTATEPHTILKKLLVCYGIHSSLLPAGFDLYHWDWVRYVSRGDEEYPTKASRTSLFSMSFYTPGNAVRDAGLVTVEVWSEVEY